MVTRNLSEPCVASWHPISTIDQQLFFHCSTNRHFNESKTGTKSASSNPWSSKHPMLAALLEFLRVESWGNGEAYGLTDSNVGAPQSLVASLLTNRTISADVLRIAMDRPMNRWSSCPECRASLQHLHQDTCHFHLLRFDPLWSLDQKSFGSRWGTGRNAACWALNQKTFSPALLPKGSSLHKLTSWYLSRFLRIN